MGHEDIAMWVGGRYRSAMDIELMGILWRAKLDEKPYQVLAFSRHREHFVIFVAATLKRTPIIEN